MVELRPVEDDVLLHRDVVLVLKCAKSVNWVIEARGVGGKLVVVVRQQRQTTSHHSSDKKWSCSIRMCLLLPSVGEAGYSILGRTVKFHSTSGTVNAFQCQGITQRAWNIFQRQSQITASRLSVLTGSRFR